MLFIFRRSDQDWELCGFIPVSYLVPKRYTSPYMSFHCLAHRCMSIFLMVLSLLFSQLALANYVCPGTSGAAAMVDTMAAGEPCEGMDLAQPVLCHQFKVNAPQSVEQAKVATPTLPAIIQVLVVPAVLDAASTEALAVEAATEARPPPDPLFLSTLRLRV